MKIDLSNPDNVRWLFNNRVIALLQKENAPLILSFFFHAFKERNTIAYLNAEIIAALSDFLLAVNQQSEQYSGTPKYYLERGQNSQFKLRSSAG